MFEKRAGYRPPEIAVHAFKTMIDEVDTLLAQHNGFTGVEPDSIINYDIKYRMGRETEVGEDP